jgi:hypothetical protein
MVFSTGLYRVGGPTHGGYGDSADEEPSAATESVAMGGLVLDDE